MLGAQAQAEDIPIASNDEVFDGYGVRRNLVIPFAALFAPFHANPINFSTLR